MKSVLVIDKPINCDQCDISNFIANTGQTYCPIIGSISDNTKVSDNCLLRDLPGKEACNEYDFEHYRNGVSVGWNRCIEKITREVPNYAGGYTGKDQE